VVAPVCRRHVKIDLCRHLGSRADSNGRRKRKPDFRIGQTRSEVHDRLGREGGDLTKPVFQPAAPGLLCDFYKETNRNVGYRFCLRAGVFVCKDLGGPL
jgi:hypothetical protein